MKKLLMILPLVFLLCFTFCCQKPEEVIEEPAVDVKAEQKAVLAVDAAFLEAVKAKDIDRVMSVFADDAVLSSSGDMYFRSKEEIKKMFETSWVEWSSSWEVEKVEVSQSGDLAYTLIKREAIKEEEGQVVERIIYGNLNLFKKQIDGSWKIIAF